MLRTLAHWTWWKLAAYSRFTHLYQVQILLFSCTGVSHLFHVFFSRVVDTKTTSALSVCCFCPLNLLMFQRITPSDPSYFASPLDFLMFTFAVCGGTGTFICTEFAHRLRSNNDFTTTSTCKNEPWLRSAALVGSGSVILRHKLVFCAKAGMGKWHLLLQHSGTERIDTATAHAADRETWVKDHHLPGFYTHI